MFLQFYGPTSYKLDVQDSRLAHNLNRGMVGMILTMKRNDTGPKLRAVLRDNFGRKVNLHNAKIKFIMKSIDAIGGPENEVVVTSDEHDIQILNQLSSQTEGSFERLFNSEETSVAGKYKAEFQIDLKGSAKSRKGQTFELESGQTLKVKVDGGAEQTITFDAGDFVSIGVASTQEVIDSINAQIVGATAYAFDGCFILLQSDAVSNGSVQITGGTASDALGFNLDIMSAERVSVPTEQFLVYIIEDLDSRENEPVQEDD